MPTYEYICNKCKKTFEAIQRVSEEPYKFHAQVLKDKEDRCPGSLTKLISKSSFSLKGPGWFKSGGY